MNKRQIIKNMKLNSEVNPIIKEIISIGCKVEFGSIEEHEAEKKIIDLMYIYFYEMGYNPTKSVI